MYRWIKFNYVYDCKESIILGGPLPAPGPAEMSLAALVYLQKPHAR